MIAGAGVDPLLVAASLQAFSGLPGLLLPRRRPFGQWIAVAFMVIAGVVGTAAIAPSLLSAHVSGRSFPWSLPVGRFDVSLDALSGMFLLPALWITALGSIYGLSYWRQGPSRPNAPRLQFFYGLLAGSMVLVLVARDGVLFLMAWEVMALSAYFLITTEDHDADVRSAGWVYLVATHVGTLALMAMFAVVAKHSGSLALCPMESGRIPATGKLAVFVLAVIGFGLKAGVMPLHVWLPGAHAMAPSHVSAVLSGVMIKVGVYGIVRVCGLLPDPPSAWGAALLALGAISGIAGVVFAIAQHDLKRLLAYHSIENIGIILMGVGLAMLGRAVGRPDWVVLGLAGALLHVWNHGLFKSLLFFGAGSVIHATGTREMDRLGGLAKVQPTTFALFLVGAVAICGLPPLNGFVSELLIYLGLFRTMGIGPGTFDGELTAEPTWAPAVLAVPALAMIGALAVACFTKVIGVVFLGEPRRPVAQGAHEAERNMLAPMALLALCCFAIGLAPGLVGPVMDRAVGHWAAASSGELPSCRVLAPFGWVTTGGLVALVAAGFGTLWLRSRMRREGYGTVGTWDCGYARPTARMQYTASSFAQMLVQLFAWMLRPRVHRPRLDGVFPSRSAFSSHVADVVLQAGVTPVFRAAARGAQRLRVLQQGRVQMYILYILVFLCALLGWLAWQVGVRR